MVEIYEFLNLIFEIKYLKICFKIFKNFSLI